MPKKYSTFMKIKENSNESSSFINYDILHEQYVQIHNHSVLLFITINIVSLLFSNLEIF